MNETMRKARIRIPGQEGDLEIELKKDAKGEIKRGKRAIYGVKELVLEKGIRVYCCENKREPISGDTIPYNRLEINVGASSTCDSCDTTWIVDPIKNGKVTVRYRGSTIPKTDRVRRYQEGHKKSGEYGALRQSGTGSIRKTKK